MAEDQPVAAQWLGHVRGWYTPEHPHPRVSASHATRRLAELASSVRVVYVPHFTRYAVDPLFLAEIADGFEQLVAGQVPPHPAEDYSGYPVQEATLGRFYLRRRTG